MEESERSLRRNKIFETLTAPISSRNNKIYILLPHIFKFS